MVVLSCVVKLCYLKLSWHFHWIFTLVASFESRRSWDRASLANSSQSKSSSLSIPSLGDASVSSGSWSLVACQILEGKEMKVAIYIFWLKLKHYSLVFNIVISFKSVFKFIFCLSYSFTITNSRQSRPGYLICFVLQL